MGSKKGQKSDWLQAVYHRVSRFFFELKSMSQEARAKASQERSASEEPAEEERREAEQSGAQGSRGQVHLLVFNVCQV